MFMVLTMVKGVYTVSKLKLYTLIMSSFSYLNHILKWFKKKKRKVKIIPKLLHKDKLCPVVLKTDLLAF